AHPFAGTFALNDKVNMTGVYGTAPFTFTSSNPAVASIDASGVMTAVAQGEAQITVTDSKGATATTGKLMIGATAPPPPDGGSCPLGDPALCDAICQIMPDAPWCTK
ncbi:MAG: Ig-like domain-containing protein, partial [Bdellovibrionota bacterium]